MISGRTEHSRCPSGRTNFCLARRPGLWRGSIFGPGRWRFDANISKSIKLAESKTLQFRLDATDVLNHPEPNAPNLNLTGAAASNFGLIVASGATPAKTNLHRQLQAQLRF